MATKILTLEVRTLADIQEFLYRLERGGWDLKKIQFYPDANFHLVAKDGCQQVTVEFI